MSNWKIITAFPKYEISSNGYIRHIDTLMVRKNIVSKRGYAVVTINQSGKMKTIKIHRHVAIAFIPNPLNYTQINHKDGNKLNNRLDNLEWCTQKHNNEHALRTGLREHNKPFLGKRNELNKDSTPILQFDLNGNFIKAWPSLSEVERGLGVPVQTTNISRSAKNKKRNAYGFKWEYGYEKDGNLFLTAIKP